MKSPGIGKKPSPEHIIWTAGRGGVIKRFHGDQLQKWASHYGFDFDTYTRVDHDRGDERRKQYRVVFSYTTDAGEAIEMDGEEWTINPDERPRTFVEIDEEGMMRLQGFSVEKVLDVCQLWHEGTELVVRAAGEKNRQRLDARDLTA